MIERLALVLVVGLASLAAFYALRMVHIRRMQPPVETGLPSLLYFRSDSCAVCPTQGRLIDQLAMRWGGQVRFEHIDAERDTDATTRYRVFTVPTTVLVDRDGKVHHVNYGLADAQKLERQLSAILPKLPQHPASAAVLTTMNSAPSAD